MNDTYILIYTANGRLVVVQLDAATAADAQHEAAQLLTLAEGTDGYLRVIRERRASTIIDIDVPILSAAQDARRRAQQEAHQARVRRDLLEEQRRLQQIEAAQAELTNRRQARIAAEAALTAAQAEEQRK